MNQIEPYALWVGNGGDGRATQALFENEIRAVVELAVEDATLRLPHEFMSLRFPLIDGTGNDPDMIRLAVRSLAFLVGKGIPTLACCGGGMSRSPVIAAAALASVRQVSLEESLSTIANSHATDVTPGLWDEVVRTLREAE